jgi:hypothetical protein
MASTITASGMDAVSLVGQDGAESYALRYVFSPRGTIWR